MSREAAALRIEGLVQGVGFRWWAVAEARRLGLDGWARNRRDGSVQILAVGSPEAIDALEAACRDGPPAARVTGVVRSPAQDDGVQGFAQRETV